MEGKRQGHVLVKIADPHLSLAKGMALGMIGGLAATAVMDLILICAFSIAGKPPFTCFSMVGDTVVRVLSFQAASSIPLGAAAHYLLGPMLGVIFGAATQSMPALQMGSQKKMILFAVLYAELMSQPLLALMPIFLRMAASETLQLYWVSSVMHLIWGCILGFVCSQGLRLPELCA